MLPERCWRYSLSINQTIIYLLGKNIEQ